MKPLRCLRYKTSQKRNIPTRKDKKYRKNLNFEEKQKTKNKNYGLKCKQLTYVKVILGLMPSPF